jgi:hypothetical protein
MGMGTKESEKWKRRKWKRPKEELWELKWEMKQGMERSTTLGRSRSQETRCLAHWKSGLLQLLAHWSKQCPAQVWEQLWLWVQPWVKV